MDNVFFQFEPFQVTRVFQLVCTIFFSILVLWFTFNHDSLEKKYDRKKLWFIGMFLVLIYSFFFIWILSFDRYKEISQKLVNEIENNSKQVSGIFKISNKKYYDGIDRFYIGENYFEIVQPHRNSLKGCYRSFLSRERKIIDKDISLFYLELDTNDELFNTVTKFNDKYFCTVKISVNGT